MKPMPLSWIPNQEGYQFVGIRHDGTKANCYVVKLVTGAHVIRGEAEYKDLMGWMGWVAK